MRFLWKAQIVIILFYEWLSGYEKPPAAYATEGLETELTDGRLPSGQAIVRACRPRPHREARPAMSFSRFVSPDSPKPAEAYATLPAILFTVLHAGVSTVRPYRNVKIGYTLRESMHMLIRHATMEDLDAIEAVEAACFPPAEAATNESLTARVATYPDHFWLLINTDADDDACFPASVKDGTLVGFVNGMTTNEKDLADVMYEDVSLHDEHGAWQMIFGVDVAPVYQHRGCASYLLRRVILDSTTAGRKGIVLTCKERLVGFYARLGFVDEGMSASTHGNAAWHQMRLTLTQSPSEESFVESDPDAKTMEIPVVSIAN